MKRSAKDSSRPRKLLPLPIGNSDWGEVKAGYWSADKTQLISGLLDRKSTVAIFTRPRRFGKTFALRMLRTFFEKKVLQLPRDLNEPKEYTRCGTIRKR